MAIPDQRPTRVITAADRPRTTAMLARAFADDPAMAWIFPDPANRAGRLPRLFALMLDSDLRAGRGFVTADGEAATLWRAPGRAHVSTWELLARAIPMVRALGGALGRAMAVSDAIGAHAQDPGWWYLHIAGCEPAAQGQGLGGAAIRAGIATAGATPTYLETATESNLGLYTALGFAVTGEWQVPNGGPRFWSMRRAPG